MPEMPKIKKSLRNLENLNVNRAESFSAASAVFYLLPLPLFIIRPFLGAHEIIGG
jgi:hypothetical protein